MTPRRGLSLITKLTLATCALLVAAMAPFGYLNIRTVQKLLYEETVAAAERINETIVKTTHSFMLLDDRETVYRMIKDAGRQEDVEHIRLITKGGVIAFSTDPTEVDTYVDKTAAACDMCHGGGQPLKQASTMDRSRRFTDAGGREVLGFTQAIYNQESCWSAPCHFHAPDQHILGVLDTVVSLDRMHDQTRQYTQRLATLTAAMLLAIAASLTLLVERLVHRPIKEILGHTRRVGDLDLASRVPVRSADEIGVLATSFNEMTERLQTAKEQLEEWTRTLETRVDERTRELKQMQRQLIRSEKLASLGEIVAGIAHELNNPLTGILVLSSLLADSDQLDPTRREDVETIVRESQRCARIVGGLLDFAKASSPQKVKIDLHAIMDSSLALIGGQSIFHDVDIVKRYADGLPRVLADPNQIEQVFINILINAGQAMAGGGTLSIETEFGPEGVAVRIRDTGCGIPEDHLPKIFDPFFSTKESHGTGLGLSVSYGIIENHGGSIEVSSRVASGTVFTIRLPAAGEGPGQRRPEQTLPNPAPVW